ncbi:MULTISPECIES: NAD(+) diphosphatase [unclassified Solwaraspora]|uniref:NAD(+) diphosphatase n=1 Tax=unclassified Solwaraspora TaxID=2627926 RepID=UPI00248B6ECE|nr:MULTISPECIES: NAD(+) diphosphatase [unclassified Solwaraspora]WBC00139.1 NAD(+) diphosphatase [Solwaraspora sp. WMMA2059]WBC23797.1 NAD(+) diphosphatase [Solwaraspora sp. WMMA2080]WJK37979.1 NAD(+) diphosphatase [Solwaraspora sp. WMMA2065]
MDRAAPYRRDPQWLARAWPRSLVLVVDGAAGGRALVRDGADGTTLVLVRPDQAPAVEVTDRIFIGTVDDGTPVFAVDAALPSSVPPSSVLSSSVAVPSVADPGLRSVTVREVGHLLPDRDAGLFTTAAAMVSWHARHRYSASSGLPTRATDGGWSRVDDTGTRSWPRTDPAVIVLLTDGGPGPDGRCLLANHHARRGDGPDRLYSCLAGFVEPGESAESAVAREVAEEVGLTLTAMRYVGSQSWPFPGTLMLGYLGRVDPEQPLRPDPEEIIRARWFTRAEVAAGLAGERLDSGDGYPVRFAPPASIAAFLIRSWVAETAPDPGR